MKGGSAGGTLLHELRRRRVFRTTTAYLAAAFVLLQAADLIIPALPVPEATYSILTIIIIVGLPVTIVLSWFFDITPTGLRRTLPLAILSGDAPPASDAEWPDPASMPVDGPLDSIAVLPFVDMSPQHDQEYLSDGLTEELLNLLSKRSGLRVAARTSSFAFKGRHGDVRGIGGRLRVATVLEGSVRKAGNRIRISAQLINTSDGFHIWSDTFDRELVDVFAIQDEIAAAIVDALRPQLAEAEPVGTLLPAAQSLGPAPTRNMRAHDLYLLGLYHFNKATERDVHEAVHLFQRSIDEDPSYAQPYIGLARAYSWALIYQSDKPLDLMPRAQEAAAKAIMLDPTLAEAYAAAGYIEHKLNWDRAAAERLYSQALELNDNLAQVYCDRAELLWSFGRLEESMGMVQRGLALDPMCVRLHSVRAVTYLFQRRYDEAIAAYRRTSELCSDSPLMHLWTALGGLMVARRYAEAEAELTLFATQSGEDASSWAVLARGLADPSMRAVALERITAIRPEQIGGSYFLAGLYALYREEERALEWLETAVDERQVFVHSLLVEPWFDELHEHPRFRRLLERVGLQRPTPTSRTAAAS